MLSELPDYFIPEEGDLKYYKEVIIIKSCLKNKTVIYCCH